MLIEPDVCPGLFYRTSALDGYIIRIRIPGGKLNWEQGEAIATIIKNYTQEPIQITNRGNLQIRSVAGELTKEVFESLQNLGLAAKNEEVDRLRNLMTSPTAGIDPQEIIDTTDFIRELDEFIQTEEDLVRLPTKFSIGIDGGGKVGIGNRSKILGEHRYNEIQLSAISLDDGVCFRLGLGGDKELVDTKILIKPSEYLLVIKALILVFLDYIGQNLSLKKPRMKNLLADWGLNNYLKKVSMIYPLYQVADDPLFIKTEPYGYLGINPQKQLGLCYVGVNLKLGKITLDQWRGLLELSQIYGTGNMTLTPWQSILLPNIPYDQLDHLLLGLDSLELVATATSPDAAIVACTGQPGCSAAATNTQADAIALSNYLNEKLTKDYPINIHLTGCPKSCAQPLIAEITLLGISNDRYYLYIGDHPIRELSFTDAILTIQQLIELYQKNKTPNQSWQEFIYDRIH